MHAARLYADPSGGLTRWNAYSLPRCACQQRKPASQLPKVADLVPVHPHTDRPRLGAVLATPSDGPPRAGAAALLHSAAHHLVSAPTRNA